jgi:hypothetical protein
MMPEQPSGVRYCNIILRYENKKKRDKAIFKAHIRYGYTLKEIAEHMVCIILQLAGLLIE